MTELRCPICRKVVGAPAENAAFPFCSGRCRLIDLGSWLGESYRVPGERIAPSEHDEDEERPS